MYYKHQKGSRSVALIPGVSISNGGRRAFIQVITEKDSYYFDNFDSFEYKHGGAVRIGGNHFSKDGVKIDIEENGVSIRGEISYKNIMPPKYDIMGPFKYLPMECRHSVISLHHRLDGSLSVCGEDIDFTGGVGYIEGDSGSSFPDNYVWIQCNDFPEKACVMAAVADVPVIPFKTTRFRGCVCVIYINGTEYRLAAYLGVKILCCNESRIVLKQGRLSLEIEFATGLGHKLLAPVKAAMSREIRERAACGARFRFAVNGKALLDQYSENASIEYVTRR